MNINEIRKIAKQRAVKLTSGMKKADMVHAIQRHEGNVPCYGTSSNLDCDQRDCLWYGDCMKESKKS